MYDCTDTHYIPLPKLRGDMPHCCAPVISTLELLEIAEDWIAIFCSGPVPGKFLFVRKVSDAW